MMNKHDPYLRKYRPNRSVAILALLLVAALAAGPAAAGGGKAFCSQTAKLALRACRNEVADDYWIAQGNCLNIPDDEERAGCLLDAKEAKGEDMQLCREQLAARRDVCDQIGEQRYAPDFDPADFVDPDDIGDSVAANPYFPLIPGAMWIYEGGEETVTVTVLEETKLIEGVTCRVVNDVVEVDGEVVEDTDDWYAQDNDGNVYYCGEEVKDYETFEGDDPVLPELVDTEGSFKVGRDGARPGIIMLAAPQVGDVYRQEMSLGDAEDVAEVIALDGTEAVPAAECSNDCLVTREFSPLEPDIEANKYYAPGVGPILEVEDGQRVELVDYFIP